MTIAELRKTKFTKRRMRMNRQFIRIRNLSFSYGKNEVIRDLNLDIMEGGITTLIGSNGCGKSTLFHLMTRNLGRKHGSISLLGKEIEDYKLKEFAQTAAIVHQYNTAPDDITVERLVSYGRIPYHTFGKSQTKTDEELIERAMKITGVYSYKDAYINELSGGQRQRVFIAMAIAQNTKILFLDEPTTYLDIRYQLEILNLIRDLNRKHGITILMVLHDNNQACSFSDQIIALNQQGQVAAQGAPEEILNSALFKKIYGISLDVTEYQGKKIVITA